MEPSQDQDGYWIPGLVGHNCPGYDTEKALQAERKTGWDTEKKDEEWVHICGLSGLGDRLMEMTLENFERDRQPSAFDGAERFFTEPKSLIFCGPYGTGKTHLAASILRRWLRIGFERQINEPYGSWAGGRGFFITLPRLLLRIQATYKTQRPTETEDSIINHLIGLPLLVLDDVGKQKKSDYAKRTLFNVIDGRYVKNRHIIITANVSHSEFVEHVGEAVASRLLEMGKIVTMRPSGDYRIREGQ